MSKLIAASLFLASTFCPAAVRGFLSEALTQRKKNQQLNIIDLIIP